jgi:hypothetical protein
MNDFYAFPESFSKFNNGTDSICNEYSIGVILGT